MKIRVGYGLGTRSTTNDAARYSELVDTLEPDGRALRHHVFALEIDPARVRPREGQQLAWFSRDRLPADRAAAVDRSLAGIGA